MRGCAAQYTAQIASYAQVLERLLRGKSPARYSAPSHLAELIELPSGYGRDCGGSIGRNKADTSREWRYAHSDAGGADSSGRSFSPA